MKKVVIWGTGLNAEDCILCLDSSVCDVTAFIETNPSKVQFHDIKVLAPEELIELGYDYLFIASQYTTEIKEKLIQCQICLDNVIDWLDFRKYPENYSTEILEFFTDDFLKRTLLCKQWSEKEFEINKKMFSKEYEKITQLRCVYVYDLRMNDYKLAVLKLIDMLVNRSQIEDAGILFIPDEKGLDTVWYHNLLFQLEHYCLVLWEDMRSFYMGCKKEFGNKFILDQMGILLTKSAFSRICSSSRYIEYKYCFEPTKLKSEIDQAERIDFYFLHAVRIGETIRRVLWLKNRTVAEHTLTVLIPSGIGSTLTLGTNACLTELISREFCMIRDESELWFWVKVIFEHRAKCSFHAEFDNKSVFRIKGENGKAVLDFSDNEVQLGEELIGKKFHLSKSEYVCICVRDSEFITATMPYSDVNNCYRNYNLQLFMKAMDFLNSQGLKNVRMGKRMKVMKENSVYIDFQNRGYDEFLDLILHRNCKYVLGTDSGIAQIAPWMFGKPMAAVWTGYPMLDEFANYKSEDLVIFGRLKNVKEDRELSLYETMKKCHEWWIEYEGQAAYFRKNGLVIIPPDEEEICGLAMEMNYKLDGEWIEEDGDRELIDIFNGVVEELYRDTNLELYSNPSIATTFLRKHKEEILNMKGGG